MNESSLDKKSIWYFGNNRCKNLRLSQPKWDAPFFLTTNYEYAQEYSDYGVYTIILKNENGSKILDFNSSLDVKKLHWPKILIDKIREGKNDLNSIGYDMYILANQTGNELMYIQDNAEWRAAAQYFMERSIGILKLVKSNSMWGSEKDHQILLQMWKDIHDAGFDGFMHIEFGSKILAIFNFHCIDKISIEPISRPLDEEESISNNEVYLSNMAKSFADKAWFLKHIPKDVTTIVDFGGGTGDFAKFCQSKRPDLTYVVIDNNTDFFDQAKSNGFITASSLQNLVSNKSIDFNRALLVLSSVIHEIYSYANANEFWQDIKKCRFRAIAIRDMSYDETAMRNAPIDAICWVYENVLMSDKVKYKGIPFREITESFEDVWGKICDPESKKIDGKNLFHFLIKYRYQENWSREVEENYLPISKERLASILASIGYSFKHKESSKLEFYGKCWKKDFKLDIPDNNGYRKQFYDWLLTLDTHIKWFLEKKEQKMDRLDENKAAYLKKYADEKDVDIVVEMFWAIRNRLSAPQNDIDWWIKKPFGDLKNFVQNFDTSNKRQRRDANYKQQAIDNGAKLLDTKDGYEMWYVPTYDAMVYIGRFYKGRSAKWCVASDDPDFWFDNHEDSEFVVLVREHPKNDEFDKVAIEMMNHGRYYNEDDIIPWDLENEDWTFDRGVIDNSEELVHYAWQLFKDNGETREQYFG